MASPKRKYTFLPDGNSDDEFVYETQCSRCSKRRRSVILILVSLELINVAIVFLYWVGTVYSQRGDPGYQSDYGRFKDYNTTVAFYDIYFEGTTMRIPGSDSTFWRNLIPEGEGVVSVPTTWAREQQLVPSKESPTNSGHSIYQVAVFHQLHCLQMIENHMERRESDPKYNIKILSFQHILHCVDWIRQSLMCNADITLDPTENFLGFGNENPHQCRDFRALFDWTYQNRWTELKPTLRKLFPFEDLTT